MRQCEILVNRLRAGVLTETDDRTFIFQYDLEYLTGDNNGEVSLTLPLRQEPYVSPYLFPCFANMLSEGANREIQAKYLGIDADDDFGIMLATCHTDTIGAVTVKPIQLSSEKPPLR